MTQLSKATVGGLADHPVVEAGARAGYAVNGVLHLLIAWLALQVAFGSRGANADPAGAMEVLAQNPVGWVLLIAVAVGFALLAVWQVAECVRARRTGDRVKAAAKAVVYLALAWAAGSFLFGVQRSGADQAQDATGMLMDLPFGTALVVLAGLAIVAVGGYHGYKGWTKGFRRDLSSDPGRFAINAGRVGYIARGVAFVAVGAGLAVAGLNHRPSESKGLDGALHAMVTVPMGQALVALVAAGFAAFGVYSFARARHAAI